MNRRGGKIRSAGSVLSVGSVRSAGLPLLVGLCLAMSSVASAESARSLVETGNLAYQQGKFAEALDAYEKAAVSEPESPQLYFNRGAAQYRKGEFLKAAEIFEQAAGKSKDLALEARSRYNIGNCYFREGERQRDSDARKSLEALQQSIASYQQALQLDPTLTDAGHNIEVARLAVKELLDALKKSQDQTKKQQQQAADTPEDKQGQGRNQPEQEQGQQQQKEQGGQQQPEKQQPEKQPGADRPANEQTGKQADGQATAPSSQAAADILNEEKENRQQRQVQGGGAPSPVDKDW